MESNKTIGEALGSFIDRCSSPFHTVQVVSEYFHKAGFISLSLGDEWELEAGRTYVLDAFGSTLIAFRIGEDVRQDLRIASAHTDFPSLRVKPNAVVKKNGYSQLNVETYGGALLSTWFDRPLAIAGKIAYRGKTPFQPHVTLFDSKEAIGVIPNVAIHLNREANDGVKLNKQTHMLPIVATRNDEFSSFESFLAQSVGLDAEDLLSYELGLYPATTCQAFGCHGELFSGPRLDNMTSVKGCMEGLLQDDSNRGLHMIALFDNEEVGSRTKQGAASALLLQVLQRIYLSLGFSLEECIQDVGQGVMISADVAHAMHPNYSEKYDITNQPILNGGLAIKYAASQTYAGDAEAISIVKALCEESHIPYQLYVNRSDQPGGSTIGSIASAALSMRTVDVGIPILGMHSAVETMGTADQKALELLVKEFFVTP